MLGHSLLHDILRGLSFDSKRMVLWCCMNVDFLNQLGTGRPSSTRSSYSVPRVRFDRQRRKLKPDRRRASCLRGKGSPCKHRETLRLWFAAQRRSGVVQLPLCFLDILCPRNRVTQKSSPSVRGLYWCPNPTGLPLSCCPTDVSRSPLWGLGAAAGVNGRCALARTMYRGPCGPCNGIGLTVGRGNRGPRGAADRTTGRQNQAAASERPGGGAGRAPFNNSAPLGVGGLGGGAHRYMFPAGRTDQGHRCVREVGQCCGGYHSEVSRGRSAKRLHFGDVRPQWHWKGRSLLC